MLPDILVCNASIQAKIPWTEFPLDEAQKEMQVNFFATLRMFQRCYPKMKAQKWGRLITVGSVNESRPHPDMCVYAATKSAQDVRFPEVRAPSSSWGLGRPSPVVGHSMPRSGVE